MNNINNFERGQVLILIVLGVIGLLGMTALAVDGGLLYSNRRDMQNASDASALAGAEAGANFLTSQKIFYKKWNCSDSWYSSAVSKIKDAAIPVAGFNNYVIERDLSANNGVSVVCDQEDHGGWVDKYMDIIVNITAETPTSFVHFVYTGPVKQVVEAVTRVRPQSPLAFGNAIVALNFDDCLGNQNGVIFSGSTKVKIKGGGVLSNGCLTGNGNKFVANVNPGEVTYGGGTKGTLDNISPDPEPTEPIPLTFFNISPPQCDLDSGKKSHSGDGEISPGYYSSISNSGGELKLLPGLYCLESKSNAMKITGGTLYGDGVTIYVIDGDVEISGNVEEAKLNAPGYDPDPFPALPGILFFMRDGNDGILSITGNSKSEYNGTIFAPTADIFLAGTSDVETPEDPSSAGPSFTQVIGLNVEISGDSQVNIRYDGSTPFETPPMVNMEK